MGRVREKFIQLKRENKKAFIPYLTFGYPSLELSKAALFALQEAKADLIELGLAFSDPVADGPTIQASSQIALREGAHILRLFEFLEKNKKRIEVPLLIMSYFNPIYAFGLDKFFSFAKRANVSGVIVPDLLPEEAKGFIKAAGQNKIDTVFFASLNTQSKRLRIIDNSSSGFVYYVSVYGVTGSRQKFAKKVEEKGISLKKQIKSPLCIGFGISTPQQVRRFKKVFDGVIVGSALIKAIATAKSEKEIRQKVLRFVKWLNK